MSAVAGPYCSFQSYDVPLVHCWVTCIAYVPGFTGQPTVIGKKVGVPNGIGVPRFFQVMCHPPCVTFCTVTCHPGTAPGFTDRQGRPT